MKHYLLLFVALCTFISVQAQSDSKYQKGLAAYKAGNYPEAVKWYYKAAKRGNAAAQYDLGICYYYGYGVTKNVPEAVKLIHLAAEQGVAEAQFDIGLCYADGEGVTRNLNEATKWWHLSAEQGNAMAQYYLGSCYYHGDGVTKDLNEAAKLFYQAAEQGVAVYGLSRYYVGNVRLPEQATVMLGYANLKEQ